jgi:cobyric acid synthase
VFGVVPFVPELGLPDEDRLSLTSGPRRWGRFDAPLQIAAVVGPHVSNFTDLDALTFEDDVCVRLVERPEELGQPDAIVMLGTKNTLSDLAHFRRTGVADAVLHAHRMGSCVIGICGGLQMLGEQILDDSGVESRCVQATGLGLLPITTRYAAEKTVRRVQGRHVRSGQPVVGYEIHHGISDLETREPWLVDADGTVLGVHMPERLIYGTYLHGLFDADGFRREFLDDLRERKGMTRLTVSRCSSSLEPRIDSLAKTFRDNVDVRAIYRLMGLG